MKNLAYFVRIESRESKILGINVKYGESTIARVGGYQVVFGAVIGPVEAMSKLFSALDESMTHASEDLRIVAEVEGSDMDVVLYLTKPIASYVSMVTQEDGGLAIMENLTLEVDDIRNLHNVPGEIRNRKMP